MILLNPFVVVHSTHILMHPRVHRAHRLRSSALEVLLQANSVVILLVNSREWCSLHVVFSQTRNLTVIAVTGGNMYATSMAQRKG